MVIFKEKYTVLTFFGIIFCWYWFSFDLRCFSRPTSTVLLDRKGEMLGAKLASDGNWRFPKRTDYPVLFEQLIIQQQDEYFYYHLGFNPLNIFKALLGQKQAGTGNNGVGSISTQVIRIYRGYRERTILEKTIEFFLALRLEGHLSKKQILQLYAFNAPFGSNIIGIDAAAWKYFGRGADELNLSQMAFLALLPGEPGLIHVKKNQGLIIKKRKQLLAGLLKNNIIDKGILQWAEKASLPQQPLAMPNYAPHFLELVQKDKGLRGTIVKSSIDKNIQLKVAVILQKYSDSLQHHDIHNGAAIVMDPYLNKPLAYVANTSNTKNSFGHETDMIQAFRSAGNTLTPFLYAAMLSEGKCLPDMLIPDYETGKTAGSSNNILTQTKHTISAKEIPGSNLNRPAFNLIKTYGEERFYGILKNLGHKSLIKPWKHYGISLVSGGSETSLWRLVCNYSTMVRVLEKDYFFDKPKYGSLPDYPFKASAIFLTFEALNKSLGNQLDGDSVCRVLAPNIALKTAAGVKNRDSWTIAATPEYVVGIWLGNSNGKSNDKLKAFEKAPSVLFDILDYLGPAAWFRMPKDEMSELKICTKSGYRATSVCEKTKLQWIPKVGLKTKTCDMQH